MARKSKTQLVFKVSIRVPDGATQKEVQDYVEAAVVGWAGSLLPGQHAMQPLEPKDVSVKLDAKHTYY